MKAMTVFECSSCTLRTISVKWIQAFDNTERYPKTARIYLTGENWVDNFLL